MYFSKSRDVRFGMVFQNQVIYNGWFICRLLFRLVKIAKRCDMISKNTLGAKTVAWPRKTILN